MILHKKMREKGKLQTTLSIEEEPTPLDDLAFLPAAVRRTVRGTLPRED